MGDAAGVDVRVTTPRVVTAAELRGQSARVLPCSPVEFWADTPDGMTRLAVAAVEVVSPCSREDDGTCRPTGVPVLRLILREG